MSQLTDDARTKTLSPPKSATSKSGVQQADPVEVDPGKSTGEQVRTRTDTLQQTSPAVSTAQHADAIAGDQGRSTKDQFLVTIMIICICLFAGALATFVLYPAITTLTDASVTTWTGQGP